MNSRRLVICLRRSGLRGLQQAGYNITPSQDLDYAIAGTCRINVSSLTKICSSKHKIALTVVERLRGTGVGPSTSPARRRYSADELSHPPAMQQERKKMTATAPIDSPSIAKTVSQSRSGKPARVSASAPALHLDCSRTYIGKLEAESVVHRQGDGFPLDQSRVAYLRHLRREHRRPPRAEADADHVKVKTDAANTLDGKEARTSASDRCRRPDRRSLASP
ncbi:hypothetical protein [Bradyrhizobium sp. I1.7.5]|uniref:hypothetical protein n=1 Tax=Bradyrhizobium sp. I1.7.5 TaxID=3156363 RepID=UPI00339A0A08